MSDFYVNFIPEKPNYELDEQIINLIKSLSWYGDNVKIIVNEQVEFADAGANFERVSCPFCDTDLMGWWGEAMNKAYSKEDGFINLDIVTPCCYKNTTLNNLNYYFPQGFYKTMISMEPYHIKNIIQVNQDLQKEAICQELSKITNIKWRIINRSI